VSTTATIAPKIVVTTRKRRGLAGETVERAPDPGPLRRDDGEPAVDAVRLRAEEQQQCQEEHDARGHGGEVAEQRAERGQEPARIDRPRQLGEAFRPDTP
jgi:hypothetical protein